MFMFTPQRERVCDEVGQGVVFDVVEINTQPKPPGSVPYTQMNFENCFYTADILCNFIYSRSWVGGAIVTQLSVLNTCGIMETEYLNMSFCYTHQVLISIKKGWKYDSFLDFETRRIVDTYKNVSTFGACAIAYAIKTN